MTAYIHRVLLVVAAADVARANQAAKSFDKLSGDKTFRVGISVTGQGAPTHYWCCTQLRPATWAAVQAMQAQFPGSTFVEFDPVTEKGKPQEVLATLGLKRIDSVSTGVIVSPAPVDLNVINH
jgi:hypothetical protein